MPLPTIRTDAALQRRGTFLTRISLYLAVPMALASAWFITAGRSLWGAGGELVPVFAISFGPVLALTLLVAAYFFFKELKLQEQGAKAGLPWVTALVQASTWVLAFIFGMFVPDRIDGETVSASAEIFGQDFLGLSAGFGNTTGILTFSFATATLLMAISALRKAKALARGIDDATREELERQESMYDFLD